MPKPPRRCAAPTTWPDQITTALAEQTVQVPCTLAAAEQLLQLPDNVVEGPQAIAKGRKPLPPIDELLLAMGEPSLSRAGYRWRTHC